VLHLPARAKPAAMVLLAPPFAEELNKSRRMLAEQARALAHAGCAVLQIDLLGCGDSAGEFEDASWQAWLNDLARAAAWLRAEIDAPLVLWGVRAGCLLASDLLTQLPLAPVGLVFWQPPVDGKSVLHQFLRLRVYGDALVKPAAGAMQSLKAELQAGASVVVAGYQLPAGLAIGLEATRFAPLQREPIRGCWLELSSKTPVQSSPASTRTAAAWNDLGHHIEVRAVAGPAFWHSTEIEVAPELLPATTKAVLGLLERV